MDLMDFCGFTFNGVHSSALGFVRVSNGSRYSDSLVPDFQDQTVDVPGGNGTYFFDSFYKDKSFSIDIAFDSITEVQYRRIRQTFAADVIGELIFDEAPYKAYTAKVQSPPSLNYICFDEGGQRIYKGEGSIQFVCYYPFARSVHKYLEAYPTTKPAGASDDFIVYTNRAEWLGASGIISQKNGTSSNYYDNAPSSQIHLYNAGDTDADFCAYFPFTNSTCNLSSIYIGDSFLSFGEITKKGNDDAYLRINSKTNLVEGCSNTAGDLTGTLYNLCIQGGDFFKIPIGYSELMVEGSNCSAITYDYLYY